MMNLDLKWLLPILTPFVMLFTFRALVWCAGLEWKDTVSGVALLFSCIFGFAVGGGLVAVLAGEDMRLTLRGMVHDAR